MRNRSNLKLNSFFLLFFLKTCIVVNCISFSEWIAAIRYAYASMSVNRSCGAKQWSIYWIDKKKRLSPFSVFVFILFCKKKINSDKWFCTSNRATHQKYSVSIDHIFLFDVLPRSFYIPVNVCKLARVLLFVLCVCIVSKRCRMDDD
jgi:hypothetical protein